MYATEVVRKDAYPITERVWAMKGSERTDMPCLQGISRIRPNNHTRGNGDDRQGKESGPARSTTFSGVRECRWNEDNNGVLWPKKGGDAKGSEKDGTSTIEPPAPSLKEVTGKSGAKGVRECASVHQ